MTFSKKTNRMRTQKIEVKTFLPFLLALFILTGCDSQVNEPPAEPGTHLIHITSRSGADIALPVHCYIFEDNTLYRIIRNVTSPFVLTLPAAPQVFFYAGETEPSGLAAVETGKTRLNDFLALRTDEGAPLEFYTETLFNPEGNGNYDVALTIGAARIDVDASSSHLLQIDSISIENAPASTLLFPDGNTLSSSPTTKKTGKRLSPGKSLYEDILRLYETDTPVRFTIEGSYDGVPLTFETSLLKVVRNHRYTLKVTRAGAEMEGIFVEDKWLEIDTIQASPNADEPLFIDVEHSTFPESTKVDESRRSLTVPYTGGDLVLAFSADTKVDFESIIDEENNLQVDGTEEVQRENGKIITKYRIHVTGQGENTLPYPTTLNPKSVLRQYSTSKITLIVDSPPLYIREVTLGGKTWMAFNSLSGNMKEQVYPIKGYSIEEMYNREWVATRGALFRKDEAACPEGYRLPTTLEVRELFGLSYSAGGGSVPNSWTYGNETITATQITPTNSEVEIDGVKFTAKYLRLEGSKGDIMYIPFGGVKSTPEASVTAYGKDFRWWTSDMSDIPSLVWSLYCGNLAPTESETKAVVTREVDKAVPSYVRCIKK